MRTSRWSLNVGRVAGVRIRIHVSFLLLVVLVLMAGAASTWRGALAETAWIAVIFVCVLLHELAHSVTALRLGVKVKDIVLLPIGGVSEMERLPDDPAQEIAIAGAGPAASLLLAALALAASAWLGQHWWPPAILTGSNLARLGWLNALLAAFNLLPVLPMDGGRLLRAAWEPRLGRTGSTVAAARVGRVGALVLIAFGFIYDLWLVFIGAFLLLETNVERADAQAHDLLASHGVRDAMIPSPWTIESSQLIADVALSEALARQGVLPVTTGGRYQGVLGPDQLRLTGNATAAWDIVDREAPTVCPSDGLDHVLDVLQRSGRGAVTVVTSEGAVVGVVTTETLRDLVKSSASQSG